LTVAPAWVRAATAEAVIGPPALPHAVSHRPAPSLHSPDSGTPAPGGDGHVCCGQVDHSLATPSRHGCGWRRGRALCGGRVMIGWRAMDQGSLGRCAPLEEHVRGARSPVACVRAIGQSAGRPRVTQRGTPLARRGRRPPWSDWTGALPTSSRPDSLEPLSTPRPDRRLSSPPAASPSRAIRRPPSGRASEPTGRPRGA